ncbi:MAG: DUF2157 domain-containing protein [Clostridia bacterium]|nr:DUF2157 domain-containing protein [Clostridia bacterium]
MAHISKNIKNLRIDRHLTQEALAARMNVTRQTVSSWETGRTQPDVDMLMRLAWALQTDVETLIYGSRSKVGLEADPAVGRRTLTVVLTVMGTLFSVLGLVLIFVFFWREIPGFFKKSLAFLPLTVGAAAGVTVLLKNEKRLFFREGAAVLWTAGLVATGALVNAVFGASMRFVTLLLADILLTLPLMFLFDSVFAFSFALFAGFLEMTQTADDSWRPVIPLWLWFGVGAAILLTCLIYHLKREKNVSLAKYETWMLLLHTFAFGIFTFPFVTEEPFMRIIIQQFLTFGPCLFLAGTAIRTELSLRVPGAVFGGVTLFVTAAVFELSKGDIDRLMFRLPLIIELVLSAAAIGFCLVWGLRKKPLDAIGYCMAAVLLLSLPLTLLVGEKGFMLPLLSTLLFGVLTVVSGVKNARIARANAGIVNVCGAFILVIAAFSDNILLLGLTALLTGVVLLAANLAMVKRFKKRTEELPPDPVDPQGEEAADHA